MIKPRTIPRLERWAQKVHPAIYLRTNPKDDNWEAEVNYPWALAAPPERRGSAEKASEYLHKTAKSLESTINSLDWHSGWDRLETSVRERYKILQRKSRSSVVKKADLYITQPHMSFLWEGQHFIENPQVSCKQERIVYKPGSRSQVKDLFEPPSYKHETTIHINFLLEEDNYTSYIMKVITKDNLDRDKTEKIAANFHSQYMDRLNLKEGILTEITLKEIQLTKQEDKSKKAFLYERMDTIPNETDKRTRKIIYWKKFLDTENE